MKALNPRHASVMPQAGLLRMSPARNRCAAPLWPGRIIGGLLAVLLMITPGTDVVADHPDDAPAPRLDRPDAIHAHQLIEHWLDQGRVPEDLERTMRVRGLAGARVTLWMDGIAVGSGQAFAAPRDELTAQADRTLDMVPVLAQASGRAFGDAQSYLLRVYQQSRAEGRIDDSEDPPTLSDRAGRMQVSLQLAHSFEPISLPEDAEPSDLFHHFAPGYHGLHVPGERAENITDTLAWPGTATARNIEPMSQIRPLLHAQGYRPQDIAQLARPGGPPLQRFEVFHIVNPGLAHRRTPLQRGHEILPPHPLSERRIHRLGDRLGRHLQRRFTEDGRVRGDYLPTANQYRPPEASSHDAALAAYALLRYSLSYDELQRDDPMQNEAAQRAAAVARQLAQAMTEDEEPFDPATAALLVLTLLEHPSPPASDQRLRDELAERLLDSHQDGGGFVGIDEDEMATRSLVVAALAGWYQRTREPEAAAILPGELTQLWQRFSRTPNLAALPWFMHACHVAADTLAEDDPQFAQQWEQMQDQIGRLSARLMDRIVYHAPELGPADVIGGFEIEPVPDGAPPRPDWRTAQFLSFLAISMREPGVIGQRNELDWLLSAGLNARFLDQLTLDDVAGYYAISPEHAHDGMRLTFWDNQLSLAPHAQGLLAILELRQSMQLQRAGNP